MRIINIIMGVTVEGSETENLKKLFESGLSKYLPADCKIGEVVMTMKRNLLDEAISGSKYQVAFVLEKVDGQAVGTGAIKTWKNSNENIRIIMAMRNDKEGSGKINGLFNMEYYDGIFLKDLRPQAIANLILSGRTKDEAYEYYKVANFVPKEKAETEKTNEQELTVENTEVKTEEVVASSEISDVENVVEAESESAEPINEGINEETSSDFVEQNETDGEESEEEVTSEELDEFEGTRSESVEQIEVIKGDTKKSVSEVGGIALETSSSVLVEDTPVPQSEQMDMQGQREARASMANAEMKKVVAKNKSFSSSKTSLKKILQSEESAMSYFAKRTGEIYRDDSKEKKKMDRLDNIFIETYNKMSAQLGVVFQDLSSGKIEANLVAQYVVPFLEGYDLSEEEQNDIFYRFYAFVVGYDVLEDLLDAEDVKEIHVLNADIIRVKKGDERHNVNLSFFSQKRYEAFILNLLTRNRANLTSDGIYKTYTDVTFSDSYFIQVEIVDGIINSYNSPEIRIKKSLRQKRTLKELIERERVSTFEAAYLSYVIQHGGGILIGGGKSAGKSTLLNAMVDYIPFTSSGTVLQYRNEINAGNHPEITVQHPVTKTDKHDKVSIAELAKNVLSTDVDYIIYGDMDNILGTSFGQALTSGYNCWASINAVDPADVIKKLAGYMRVESYEESLEEIIKNICDKIKVVVMLDNLCVTGVYVIDGYVSANETIEANLIRLEDYIGTI